MSVSQNLLLSSARTFRKADRERLILEARSAGVLTGFLCHSHKDRNLAEGVQKWLSERGCDIYIDWQDEELPSRPNRTTAIKIQKKIRETDRFFYLATQNSSNSKWCPWEIGYADAKKGHHSIIIIPTSNYNGSYGQEYLNLYRHIHKTDRGSHAIFEASSETGGKPISSII